MSRVKNDYTRTEPKYFVLFSGKKKTSNHFSVIYL